MSGSPSRENPIRAMAKEKFNMSNLGLPAKPVVVKPVEPVEAQKIAEAAVENIHADEPPKTEKRGRPAKKTIEKPAAKAEKPLRSAPTARSRFAELPDAPSGELRKISLDLPLEWFKAIKFHCVEHDITMREFLMDVIARDLKRR